MKSEGIPCETVTGDNHEWVAVRIDGQWYQVDPTWDDTSGSWCGTHCFLMRNDNEFANELPRTHTWAVSDAMDKSSKTISTSTDYTNWYVHDVWNRMYYYNGYWYYVKDGAVRKNNIQGTEESVIYSGTNLSITGMKSGVLSVSGSEGAKQFDLREEDDTTDGTTEKGTAPTAGNTTEKETEVTTGNTTEKETEVTTGNTAEKETEVATGNTTEKTTTSTSAASQKIKAAKPVIKSVTNKKKKKIKIVLKKKVAGADGYEVKYSTNKKFKKSVKTVRFTGKSKTISKLKKNKTYYVKVRAYKKGANGTRVYSKYSDVTKVKIKK